MNQEVGVAQQTKSGLAQRLRHLLGIDRAIGFTVLARSWTILSGALTLLLISRFLSVAEQGYYYTFSSLVQIQVVFELGFSFVILQLAAHEVSALTIHPSGDLSGNLVAHSRLASILQKSVRWYSVAAALMGIVLLIAGFHFFAAHAAFSIAWRLPWICIVCAAVLTFQIDPIFSFLEGCGFVAQIARMRLTQAISGTILAWLLLTDRRGLFAPAAVISGQALAGLVFLVSKRRLLLPLLRRKCGADIVSWRTEIWPFQWRMAVSFSCAYFIFPLFNPALFAYRGAAEAGRMGMSLTIAASLGTVAYAWINTKASPFGAMIARRDFATLDRIFFRTLLQSGALLLAGEAVVLCVLFAVERRLPQLAQRMLPLPLLAVLMFAIFLNHLLYSEALYLRAHKREPLLVLSMAIALMCCASTLIAGRRWGATGVTVGYVICGGIINLAGGTYIFMRSRHSWHISPEDLGQNHD
jgi:hypothetical protein